MALSEFTQERALAELELEHTRMTMGQDAHAPHIEAIALYWAAFEKAIDEYFRTSGVIKIKDDMKGLCSALDRAQTETNAAVEPMLHKEKFLQLQRRLTAIRKAIRVEIETKLGIRRPKVLDKKKNLTQHGVRALNTIFSRLGLPTSLEVDDQYFTAEQMRLCLWLMQYLDEISAADYMREVYGERFGMVGEHIANLRQYIGQIQVSNGNPLVEVPVELLRIPSLRDLFFNKMRDKMCEEYYFSAAKEETINPVVAYLMARRVEAEQAGTQEKKGNYREQFIDDLADYFVDMQERTKTPLRLRGAIENGDGEFPAKHQRILMYEMHRQKRILNADPTGAGKTGAFIASVEMLRDMGKPCRALIICPPGEIPGEWQKRLSSENGGYFKPDLPKDQQPKVVVIPAGAGDEGMAAKKKAWEDAKTADYVIVTNARLRTSKKMRVKRPDYDPVEKAKEIGANCLCIDEAHNFRNPKGKDTENVFEISQCDSLREGSLIINTATPIYNTMDDIAAQLRLLHTGTDSMTPEQAGLPAKIDFCNLQQLARVIKKNRAGVVRNMLLLRMLRRKLAQCLPVGTKLEHEPPVVAELTPWERAYYDTVLDYPFMDCGEKIQALSRACLHLPLYGNDQESAIGETKYRQLCDQAEKYLADSKSGKIVIFHTGLAEGVTRFNGTNDPAAGNEHRYVAGRMRADFEKKNVGTFILDGTTTGNKPLVDAEGNLRRDIDNAYMNLTRQVLAQFRDDPRKGILFLLAEVGGEGIAITAADRVLWTSPSTVIPKEIQGDGRVWRKGQKNDVKRTTAYIADTIEQGKMEFAERKFEIIKKLLDGWPLTKDEIDTLMDDVKRVQREGFLSYASLSPRQKVQFIFNRIFAAGKKRVREFFAFDNGRYAKDLAEQYHQEEQLSFQGNNRRLLLGLLQQNIPDLQKKFGKHLQIADIASGTMAMARGLRGENDLTVHSSDISGAMLEVGKQSFGAAPPRGSVKECAMDELDYKDGSMHVAFLSLALQYTKHHPHKQGGDERIHALNTFNKILTVGGKGYIALPKYIFDIQEGVPDQQHLDSLYEVLENYGGFRVLREQSGRASAAEGGEDKFGTYVITVEKTGPSRILHLPRPSKQQLKQQHEWKALDFQKRRTANRNGEKMKREKKPATPPTQGAFHEKFVIGNAQVHYTTPTEEQPEKEEHQKNKQKYILVVQRVGELIAQHGDIASIPVEKLLSVSLHKIDPEEQQQRDQHCKDLLEAYGGVAKNIPIQELAKVSPVILMRSTTKKKGAFLCLANIADAQKHPTGGFGKKYFDGDEFPNKTAAAMSAHV